MNTIPQNQVEAKQLDRLAAQRQLYSDAKQILALQIILAVPCVIFWSLLGLLIPGLKVYGALWGVAVTVLDIALLTPWQKSLKQQAAKIQELFDCDVLEIEWSELKTGRRPDAEAIMESSSKFKCTDSDCSTLRDWYPKSVDKLPIYLARIVCQRANCWWDAKLRRRYATGVILILSGLTLSVFLLSLISGFSLQDFFLTVLTPLMPAFVLSLRQYNEHNETAATRDRLKEHAEKLFSAAIAGEMTPKELARASRNLQDEIYENRRSSPLIFDWVYKRLKQAHEEQMNRGAEELVAHAINALDIRTKFNLADAQSKQSIRKEENNSS